MSTPPTPAIPNPFNFTVPGAPPLAQPSFFTGPSDKLATVDNYTAQGGVINSIKDELSNLGISIPDVLKGGKALASLLPIVASIKNGQFSISNPTSLITRLLASSSQITSAFKFLSPDVQADILGGLKDFGPIAVAMGGITTQIGVTNFNNLNSVGNLINSFTNGAAQFGIVDKDSISSIIGGIVKQAGGYGITGAFSAVTAGINDATILSKAAGLSLPSVISNSDVASLKQMAGILPAGALSILNPLAIPQFSASYSRSTTNGQVGTTAVANDSATFAAAMDAYNTVDSNWNVCARPGGNAADISSLMGSSSDLTNVINNGIKQLPASDPQKDYALLTTYPQTDVMASLQANFPSVPFTTGSSSVAGTTTQSPLTNAVTSQIATSFPTSTPTLVPPAPAPIPGDGSLIGTGFVLTVWGQKVSTNTHTLMGYDDKGNKIWSDDQFSSNSILWDSPPS